MRRVTQHWVGCTAASRVVPVAATGVRSHAPTTDSTTARCRAKRPRVTQSTSHCERTLGRGTPCNLAVPPTGPRCQCQSAQAAPAEGYRRRSPSQSPPPATRCRSTASWPSWLGRRQHRSGSGSQRDFVGGTVAGPWASCRIASAAGATVTVPTAHGRRWHSLNMPQTLL